ncbi:MAG TPA: hypothetical protein VFK05_23845 [Polyangiaceae bacterium]|nr:hypothetical protein [Polyangiaceae bacterium]
MLPVVVALVLDLTTAAQASPRPRECRAAIASDGVWARMRGADAQRYCELLARGYARLTNAPKEALLAARSAESLVGPTPAVRVLSGRANLALGEGGLAYQLFQQAEADDAQAFADPKALHDYARAASLAGKPLEALRLYRLLVSRVALLDDARERAFVQIEAAAHVLAHVDKGADEALGYLAHARQQPLGLSAWINALRLLALQQSGRNEARASLAARPSPAALGSPPSASFSAEFPLLPPGLFASLTALLGERAGPKAAPLSRTMGSSQGRAR